MIKKILAFIVLVGCMQTALYAQENQNRTLINAALHGWEYEIRAGVSIGGTSPLPLPVEIRSIDAYNPTLAFMLEGNAIKWLGKTKKWVLQGIGRFGQGVVGRGLRRYMGLGDCCGW